MSADQTAPPPLSIAEAHALLTRPGAPLEVAEAEVRGVALKVWKAAPATLKQVFEAADAHGAREAIVYEGERISYAALAAAARALAARLAADGVRPGDRVALIMRNLPEWAAGFWGALLAGAIVAPLNAWWTGPELDYALKDCGARLAILDQERWTRLRPHLPACPALEKLYVARAGEDLGDPRAARLESVIGAPAAWAALPPGPAPAFTPAPDDDAAIYYTSGTTGRPKGAVLTHRNIIANLLNLACAPARAFARRGAAPPPPDPAAPQKARLLSIPLFHATGSLAGMIPAHYRGDKLVLMRRWEPGQALALIEAERITHCGGVPTIVRQMLDHPEIARRDLSSVELVSYGGAPAPADLPASIAARFPKAAPGQGWGMTETAGLAISHLGADYLDHPLSCGVATPVGEVRVAGPDGADLPPGQVGELWYKGPSVARGYWNQPEASAETFIDGWVRTGDLGFLDPEGFLTLVDRAKDMLIRGGENIYCAEVENILAAHPDVGEAAVIGRPHPSLGEEPIAVVRLKPGARADAEALRAHAAHSLAAFKIPVEIIFWPAPLPRNPNGKIVKPDLKALVQEARARGG